MCREAAVPYQAVSFHLFEISNRINLGSSKREAAKPWGPLVSWLLGFPRHTSPPLNPFQTRVRTSPFHRREQWVSATRSVSEWQSRNLDCLLPGIKGCTMSMKLCMSDCWTWTVTPEGFIYFVPWQFSHLEFSSWLNMAIFKSPFLLNLLW